MLGWGFYLEQGTDISVVALQSPQLLPGSFLELGIAAPGGAALDGEGERDLLERRRAGLKGRRSSGAPRATPAPQSHLCHPARPTRASSLAVMPKQHQPSPSSPFSHQGATRGTAGVDSTTGNLGEPTGSPYLVESCP